MSHLDGPEFEGIFMGTGENRPVMSKPPRMLPSAKLIYQVRTACDLDDATAERVADWAADWAERLGARTAKPVFDMDGNGPACSWCGVSWPLCGHQHLSEEIGRGRRMSPDPTPDDAIAAWLTTPEQAARISPTLDLAELRRLAEAATPGPQAAGRWSAYDDARACLGDALRGTP